MADFPRFHELFEIALQEMVTRNAGLTSNAIRQEGTIANAICAAIATVGEEVVRQIAIVYRNRLLTTAEGGELERLVWDWFGILRHDAQKARATCRFSRSGGGGGILPAGFRVATNDGIEFELEDAVVFTPNDTSKNGNVRAIVAGASGNVLANTIRVLMNPAFDPTMTVTNPEPASGGCERESDDDLRARARAFWSVARRGTLAAIEYGARSVPGVGMARATERDLTDGNRTVARWVDLVVADSSGRANSLLRDAVAQALDDWRPCGVYVEVQSAEVILQRIRATCAFRAGADTVAATARIRRALASYVNSLRIGERLVRGALVDVIRRDRDVAITPEPAIVEPAGDVVPQATQVIRTEDSMVIINA